MYLDNILPFARKLLSCRLSAGCRALDGTAGNGHDTLLLAELVGASGKVLAFDVQEAALFQTASRLAQAGVAARVTLIHDSHEKLTDYVDEPLDAAVFNFGWLPGGDKSCTTEAQSSVNALNAVLPLLKPNGLLLAVLYPGHEVGRREAQAVENWAENLPQQEFSVLKYGFTNRRNAPPYLLAVEKLTA
ncbi:tRNA (mnm(5)s(2)U34)-methyltransferase [Neisseria chenwenguii]|uniref:rRNA methyltransferase n=1 Tax=Neisseria chenwenguii TaxID=1853278 RepID=A0A220RZF7_9NEIS|nr:class I SAM-dependent methyltransferase [Neisseria chenwenguii]ASK26611.1 rRNA methyltransferase [Neisseria chenwenguii]ROV55377.1 methyltransferase domain-containing protein [Neisseria chenwenguii]